MLLKLDLKNYKETTVNSRPCRKLENNDTHTSVKGKILL